MAESRGLATYRFAQATVEIRYPKVHRYWDDSGKVIASLESRLHGLTCQRLGASGFEFTGAGSLGVSSATFYWDKVVISYAEPGGAALPKRFTESAAEFWRLVAFGLGIERVGRVGHRLWYYVPFPDTTTAVAWLAEQQLWVPATESLNEWGERSNEALRLQFRLADDRSVVLRLGTATMTSGATAPRSGVFVDTDFFTTRDGGPVGQLDLDAFMRSNVRFLDQRLASLFYKGK